MGQLSADSLRELIIFIIIENAQARAAASLVFHHPTIDVEDLPTEYDRAMDEINGHRQAFGQDKVETDDAFKQAVIDTLLRRMERDGRVRSVS